MMTVEDALNAMQADADMPWLSVRSTYGGNMPWREWEKLYGIVRRVSDPVTTHAIVALARKAKP